MKTGKTGIRMMTQSAVFTALLCILSPLAVPVGPVPVTLGIFAVLLTGITLEWKQAFLAVLVYILVGIVGLPVFSGGGSGFGVIVGPTGGYLWCYLPSVVLVARFAGKKSRLRAILVSACAVCLCYLVGTWQFTWVMDCGWREALTLCVWPFVPFDAVKIILAALFGIRLHRQLKSGRLL